MGKTGKREDVKPQTTGADGASVERFEKALALLHKKQWDEASKAFTQVAESNPGTSIAERARVFREVAKKKLSNEPVIEGDLYLAAVVAKNRGDLEAALESCNRGGLKGKDSRFTYLAAAIEGLRGNHDEAVKLLLKAIEMDPSNRVHAFWDPDFAEVRKSPELQPLFSSSR
jgi:tetratricopeptide (TPR) repeat protein